MTENNAGAASRAQKLDEIVFEEAVRTYGTKSAVEDKWLREYSKLGRNSSYDQAKVVLSELFGGEYKVGKMLSENAFTDDVKGFAAPEYLTGTKYDVSADIYSPGKVMEYIYSFPENRSDSKAKNAAFKRIMNKAAQETPEERYRSPDRMLEELNRLGGTKSAVTLEPQKKKLLMGLAAAVCVAVLLLIFVQANPTSAPM